MHEYQQYPVYTNYTSARMVGGTTGIPVWCRHVAQVNAEDKKRELRATN